LELNDNRLTGEELKKLSIYKDSLNKLKVSGNQISKLEDIAVLKDFEHLMHLDIDENPIAKIEDYRNKIYAALPNLNVLDGKNKDGESIYSEEDYGDEGGEDDFDNDFEERLNNLTEDQREKLRTGELTQEDLKGMGLGGIGESSEIEYDEEGEEEQDDGGDANKKQKTE